jgi:hypothetical protein
MGFKMYGGANPGGIGRLAGVRWASRHRLAGKALWLAIIAELSFNHDFHEPKSPKNL